MPVMPFQQRRFDRAGMWRNSEGDLSSGLALVAKCTFRVAS